MKLGELIPQIFYDAIARLTPGFVLIVTAGAIWFKETALIRRDLIRQLTETPFSTGVALLISAYVAAIIVDGTIYKKKATL